MKTCTHTDSQMFLATLAKWGKWQPSAQIALGHREWGGAAAAPSCSAPCRPHAHRLIPLFMLPVVAWLLPMPPSSSVFPLQMRHLKPVEASCSWQISDELVPG